MQHKGKKDEEEGEPEAKVASKARAAKVKKEKRNLAKPSQRIKARRSLKSSMPSRRKHIPIPRTVLRRKRLQQRT
jgi:hypothetical protein